jgi:hypothetical protein
MAGEKELDQDLSDVIKNPTRQTPPVRSKYEPEYVRLNAEPVVRSSDMYASIDDMPFDENDEPIDTRGHIIDNNDFVSFGEAPPVTNGSRRREEPPRETRESATPEVGEYILMVLGKLIASGSLEAIEKRVKDIIYGEDPSFKGLEVGLDDIVVLKRVALKIGVFIDD